MIVIWLDIFTCVWRAEMIQLVKQNERGGFRGYKTAGDRRRAMTMLRRRGWNYFVFYKDTNARFALDYGIADWVQKGSYYLNR